MGAFCSLKNLCEYETSKVVRFQSVSYGSLKWTFHMVVFLYVCYVLVTDKRYQKKDSVISSVHTKVKGVVQTDSRIWDTAEYTIPMQGIDSFFVITNIIMTENQFQSVCPEYPIAKAVCSSDVSCEKGHMNPQSNGIQTGRCVKYNATIKTCEVSAWCPVESMKGAPVPAVLKSAENFTVLIKNNIHFPKFNHTARNFSPKLNISCTFNKITAPACPIFQLGDILRTTGENFSEMAIQGGIMGIEINWDCNLDKWFRRCSPKYSFRRLDDKTTTEYPGYNFRFAKYYKRPNGQEERTLIKAYGIRFDILVFGTAGRFNIFELLVYIGSVLSYFGLAQFVIDFLITSYTYPCCKTSIKEYYFRKKCESALGPKWTLMYVSYVDDPHIILVDKQLSTSLQNIKGEIVQLPRDNGAFTDTTKLAAQCSSRVPVLAKAHEMQPLKSEGQTSPSHNRPSWCCCGKCHQTQAFREQLCCRRKEGSCITTSALFEQLVLSRSALEFILLYKEPLLDLNSETLNNQLRHCAYRQYIHWRFGSAEVESSALIPSCCRWKIRETYPSEDGKYTGLERKN
ncbi:P2X purinoceptor 7-like isoform X1 [Malaclemys terrapin pileata]|uniref:P2X purinoceptor 7-like isoform X1 n=1 Tax=Malaclemys terrapin pileata TaxID=2991368 RepID=UPI0023A85658|nr:P2X purinoceptor 7-like isoform X1 [Malaclemys terrapin pileata]